MNRSELRNELVLAFQYVDDRYLDIVEQEEAPRTMRFFWKQAGLVACMIGLIFILALPIVAIAAKWLGLNDLLLPVKDLPERDYIGLSGFQESAEAQALNEWQAFLMEYDSDQKIIGEIGNALTGFEEKYGQYTVYTQEMADKLEEIVRKYHLKLHTEFKVIDPGELEDYLGGKFLGENIDISVGYPYLYENGTFQFDGDVIPDGDTIFHGDPMYGESDFIGIQCIRTVKGTFDEVMLNIGNIDDYQEFSHTASCGESVILALSAGHSLIFADFDQCFILLNILGGSENGITKATLEKIADGIDFTMLKEVKEPEMPGSSNDRWKPELVNGNTSGVELSSAGNTEGTEPSSVGNTGGTESSSAGNTGSEEPSSAGNTDEEQPRNTIRKLDENGLSEMKERFKAVLLENREFTHIVNTGRTARLSLANIKEAVTVDENIRINATRFAMVDLDGNGDDEIVLWLQVNGGSDYGFEFLYYYDQEVYGFTLAYRQCLQLKTDGTFWASGGAGDTSICRLQLYEDGYAMEEVFGSGHQDEKPDVEWHDLTEDNVKEMLGIE